MTKWIVGLIILIIIVGAGWIFRSNIESLFGMSSAPAQTVTQTTTDPTANWQVYASSTMGISMKYPPGYVVNEDYAYTNVSPTKPISGVSFTIPASMATGTNLAADTYISVEQLPHAVNCTGDIFLAANVTPTTVADNGVTYSVATSTDAAAGNRYDEEVWAIPGSQPCTAVRYFVHYGDIDNYPTGAVQQFDEAGLDSDFDQIRRTLVITSSNGVMPPTSTETSTTTQ